MSRSRLQSLRTLAGSPVVQGTAALVGVLIVWMLFSAGESQARQRAPLSLRPGASAVPVSLATAEDCMRVMTEGRDPLVRIQHVGEPMFFVSVPPQKTFLSAWASNALPGPLRTVGNYEEFQGWFKAAPAGSIMVDIGAHVGIPALAVAAMGHHVISFEPVPLNRRVFSQAICFNQFADRITLVPAAVGAKNEVITIYVPREFSDNTALSKDAAVANIGGEADALPVPLVTLDTWWGEHGSNDMLGRVWLIKVDVQGNEAHVFRGAERFLRSLPKSAWIVGEHDPKLMAKSGLGTTEDLEVMSSYGFKAYGVYKGSRIEKSSWELLGSMDIWYNKE